MNPSSQIPKFEPFLCRIHSHEQLEPAFTPIAHDLIILNQDGKYQIAKNASASQIIHTLRHSNDSFASKGDENQDFTDGLTIMYASFPLNGHQTQLSLDTVGLRKRNLRKEAPLSPKIIGLNCGQSSIVVRALTAPTCVSFPGFVKQTLDAPLWSLTLRENMALTRLTVRRYFTTSAFLKNISY